MAALLGSLGALAFQLPTASMGRPMLAAANSPQMIIGAPMLQDAVDILPQAMLLAEEGGDGSINPVYILLGLIPVVAGAALLLVSSTEKAKTAIRTDPANADRLGYTAEEVAKMEELTRLRYETDLREFNEAKAKAAENGLPAPNGLTWIADKAGKKAGYFDGGNNERPTMI